MNLYGQTASIVRSKRLRSTQDVDSAVMDGAIEEAASEVNQLLVFHGIDPAQIISTGPTANDYRWLGDTVSYGAAFMYVGSTASNTASMGSVAEEWARRLDAIMANPQRLSSYSTLTGSINTIGSSATVNVDPYGDTVAASHRANHRLISPAKSNWRL